MLRCFQHLSLPHIATQLCPWQNNWYTSGASIPSSRTPLRDSSLPTPDRTAHDVSEPSSRTALMRTAQPLGPTTALHAMSRHRGAKPPRRCGLLGR